MNSDNQVIDDLLDIDAPLPAFPVPLGDLTMRGQPIIDPEDGGFHITGVSVTQDDYRLMIFRGNETDGKTIIRDPSVRGSIVSVELISEMGTQLNVRLRFHKGQVFLGADYGNECLPEDIACEYIKDNEFWRD